MGRKTKAVDVNGSSSSLATIIGNGGKGRRAVSPSVFKSSSAHVQESEKIISNTSTCTFTRPKFVCPAHSCWTCSGGPPPEGQACDENCITKTEEKTNNKNGGKKRKKKTPKDHAFGEKKDRNLF